MYKEIWHLVREYSGKYLSRDDGERMLNKIMNVIRVLKPITKEKIFEIFDKYSEPEDHHPTYDPVRRHNWDKVANEILNALSESEPFLNKEKMVEIIYHNAGISKQHAETVVDMILNSNQSPEPYQRARIDA